MDLFHLTIELVEKALEINLTNLKSTKLFLLVVQLIFQKFNN